MNAAYANVIHVSGSDRQVEGCALMAEGADELGSAPDSAGRVGEAGG
jgi:hypothetical protein